MSAQLNGKSAGAGLQTSKNGDSLELTTEIGIESSSKLPDRRWIVSHREFDVVESRFVYEHTLDEREPTEEKYYPRTEEATKDTTEDSKKRNKY